MTLKKQLYWIGGVSTSCYLLYKYIQYKWIDLQYKQSVEQTTRQNIKRRYLQNNQDIIFAIHSLLPNLQDSLDSELDVESMISSLQLMKSNTYESNEAKTKLELWEELKITTFTRLISSIYLQTLLIFFTNVQLSILGRYLYLDSVVNSNQESKVRSINENVERKFLTFSWFLLNSGWIPCVQSIKSAVTSVMGRIPLKEKIDFELIQDMILSLRESLEKDLNSYTKYLLPKEGQEEELLRECGVDDYGLEMNTPDALIDPSLQLLLNETRDYFDSPDFSRVLSSSFDEGFSVLDQELKHLYTVDLSEEKILIPMAKLIPKVNKLFPLITQGGLIERVCKNVTLSGFTMIIYSPDGWVQ